jgi:hypothetical protein
MSKTFHISQDEADDLFSIVSIKLNNDSVLVTISKRVETSALLHSDAAHMLKVMEEDAIKLIQA